MPLHLLYNATSARVGGGLSYATGQVGALARMEGVTLTILVAPWNRTELERCVEGRATVKRVRVPNAGMRYVWEQVCLPVVARGHDALISPGNFGCLLSPVPQVVVLQNANYVGQGRRLPQNASLARRTKAFLSHASMRRADLVVSISGTLTAEIRSEPSLRNVALATVRSGSLNPSGAQAPPSPGAGEVVDVLVGHEPFLLSVGHDYGHKRLDDLPALVCALAATGESVPRHVVVVGAVSQARQAELKARACRDVGTLIFVGEVSRRDVVLELYRRASVAVSTSSLEAWPLTLNEASAQGCPVVASDIPAHREVSEGRAHYFPVGDVEAMAAAVEAAARAPRPVPWAPRWTWAEHSARLVEQVRRVTRP